LPDRGDAMLPLTALFAGLLFGAGLLLAGAANPAKVLAFLDLGGAWDPSLAFTMLGAILVAAAAFHWGGTRARTLLGAPLHLPRMTRIDARLVLGSLTFGVGWGLAGFCPGPALVVLAAGRRPAVLFVGAMIAGMALFEVAERLRMRRAAHAGPAPATTRESVHETR
jgi:uncharacterized membrane protein YedE/YeeE